MTSEPFNGFPAEGLEFLDALGSKDKAWFEAHRSTYERALVTPTKAFVAALGEQLEATFAPDIVALPKTNGSIPPIHNDRRFAPDKPRYKDNIHLKFWEGDDKQTAPKLFVRIGAREIGFSAGARITPPDLFRSRVDNDESGRELVDILSTLADEYPIEIGDDQLKRVPKPYPADHPRADLLRHRGIFHVRWAEPAPASINDTDFVTHCITRLTACADLHRWLVTNL